MTAAAHRPRARRKVPSRRRRILLIATAIGAVVVGIGLGIYFRFGTSPNLPSAVVVPEPPSLDRVTDPAVKRRLAECRTALANSPHSAAAWGRLGMAFFIHDLPDESKVCLATAEQLDARRPLALLRGDGPDRNRSR